MTLYYPVWLYTVTLWKDVWLAAVLFRALMVGEGIPRGWRMDVANRGGNGRIS